MPRTIEVCPDRAALVQRAKTLIVEQIQQTLQVRDRFTIALAGGSTPKPLYAALAQESLPWDKLYVFWGDERYVAPDHPDSNQLMARQAWLDQVPIPAENIYPMPTQAGNPEQDATTHAAEIAAFFQTQSGQWPQFDLVLLGLGDDAHTASLFPGTAALQVCDRLVTVGNKGDSQRLTFTIPLINAAQAVMFLVAGANKQNALEMIFASEADNSQYPARFIQPQGELMWLLDAPAAETLPQALK
ncbi:MAG: 6-phosphogluconolactonase [Spirulina sp. SIO3F2]|nr:6-phosphogluconolactonase [Spirulina sp. SIO3F2]